MKKKIILILLLSIMLFGLAGCGDEDDEKESEKSSGSKSSVNIKDLTGRWKYYDWYGDRYIVDIDKDKITIDNGESYDFEYKGNWILVEEIEANTIYVIDKENMVALQGIHLTKDDNKKLQGTYTYYDYDEEEEYTITIDKDEIEFEEIGTTEYTVSGDWIYLDDFGQIVLYVIDNQNIIALSAMHITKDDKKDTVGEWEYNSYYGTEYITITEDEIEIDDESIEYEKIGDWLILDEQEGLIYVIDKNNALVLGGHHLTKTK